MRISCVHRESLLLVKTWPFHSLEPAGTQVTIAPTSPMHRTLRTQCAVAITSKNSWLNGGRPDARKRLEEVIRPFGASDTARWTRSPAWTNSLHKSHRSSCATFYLDGTFSFANFLCVLKGVMPQPNGPAVLLTKDIVQLPPNGSKMEPCGRTDQNGHEKAASVKCIHPCHGGLDQSKMTTSGNGATSVGNLIS